jgi:hypothetical protein
VNDTYKWVEHITADEQDRLDDEKGEADFGGDSW